MSSVASLLLVVALQKATQYLEGILHTAEAAVFIVAMVNTGVAKPTNLDIKASIL